MKLEDIKPFNDLFYKNCLYNSLFSVVEFYGCQIDPLFSYDIFYYNVVIDGDILDHIISINEIKNPAIIVKEDLGLQFHSMLVSSEIFQDIQHAIQNNMPVIIWVDSYYLPYRKDTYQKKHLPHTLLVYGIFSDNAYLKIIDHDKYETLTYKKRGIATSDLKKAYEGYLKNYSSYGYDTFYKFWRGIRKYKQSESVISLYKENYKRNKNIVSDGLMTISLLERYFLKIYQSESLLREQIENLLLKINYVMELKRAEKYVLQRMNGSDRAIELLNEIDLNFKFIRDILAKYLYSKIYDEKALLRSIHFAELLHLEKEKLEIMELI